MSDKDTLSIDPALRLRLSALAAKINTSVEALADDILRMHADEAEHALEEQAEDEQRWQRYLQTGQAIPFASVRRKLRELAAKAAKEAGAS